MPRSPNQPTRLPPYDRKAPRRLETRWGTWHLPFVPPNRRHVLTVRGWRLMNVGRPRAWATDKAPAKWRWFGDGVRVVKGNGLLDDDVPEDVVQDARELLGLKYAVARDYTSSDVDDQTVEANWKRRLRMLWAVRNGDVYVGQHGELMHPEKRLSLMQKIR